MDLELVRRCHCPSPSPGVTSRILAAMLHIPCPPLALPGEGQESNSLQLPWMLHLLDLAGFAPKSSPGAEFAPKSSPGAVAGAGFAPKSSRGGAGCFGGHRHHRMLFPAGFSKGMRSNISRWELLNPSRPRGDSRRDLPEAGAARAVSPLSPQGPGGAGGSAGRGSVPCPCRAGESHLSQQLRAFPGGSCTANSSYPCRAHPGGVPRAPEGRGQLSCHLLELRRRSCGFEGRIRERGDPCTHLCSTCQRLPPPPPLRPPLPQPPGPGCPWHSGVEVGGCPGDGPKHLQRWGQMC